MSNQLTKRYPIANVIVARLRSRLFEDRAIVASLMEGEEVTEDVIEEICNRLENISSINSTLRAFNEYLGNKPKDIRETAPRPPAPGPPDRSSSSPGAAHRGPQPPGPDELMKKLNSNTSLPAPPEKGCKDCKKPKKSRKAT